MLKYRQKVATEWKHFYTEEAKVTARRQQCEQRQEETNQVEALRQSMGQDVRDEQNRIKNVFLDSSLGN